MLFFFLKIIIMFLAYVLCLENKKVLFLMQYLKYFQMYEYEKV